MELIGYCAAMLIGLVLGLLGSGGSILSIPILVYLFQMDVVIASAYSLFIVGVTSFVGAIPKYKEHLVKVQTGFYFSIPSIISIFITRKWVVPAIPEIVFQIGEFIITKRILLLGLFAVLMIIASISMIRGRKREANEDQDPRVFLVALEGILIGFLSGLVGAGGGFLIIPALVILTGLPFKTAVGTSLLIIAINSLTGFSADMLNYDIDWQFLLTITTLAIIGILIGNRLSKKISQTKLRTAFGYFVCLVGCWILIKELLL
ncbi:sulfite exporter TauE/SafE family protein [Pseudochryseolinea flava]|uniref:Probable membrane transporter protein n=1 Tax=Pseudochryseolinea flava TaxID=2059302 RepID=A0A364Y927_9BACT|nr:sulfite exporter TauE/SafE family protein [Pseudochryseolinea flava]RAW03450.1 sulfite exporter TauE/SafE family protein [Pseudochryseolinea flava]